MKKQLIQFLLVLFLFSSSNLFSQVVIYSEDFDGPLTWSINTDIGAEGANPNFWYISCEEEGVVAGVCGEAFERLIDYCYTSEIVIESHNVKALLSAASILDFQEVSDNYSDQSIN